MNKIILSTVMTLSTLLCANLESDEQKQSISKTNKVEMDENSRRKADVFAFVSKKPRAPNDGKEYRCRDISSSLKTTPNKKNDKF